MGPAYNAPTMKLANEFVLTLSCPDAKGIVHAVSGLLYQAGCNIIDSQQFGDLLAEDSTGLFFITFGVLGGVTLAYLLTVA